MHKNRVNHGLQKCMEFKIITSKELCGQKVALSTFLCAGLHANRVEGRMRVIIQSHTESKGDHQSQEGTLRCVLTMGVQL